MVDNDQKYAGKIRNNAPRDLNWMYDVQFLWLCEILHFFFFKYSKLTEEGTKKKQFSNIQAH